MFENVLYNFTTTNLSVECFFYILALESWLQKVLATFYLSSPSEPMGSLQESSSSHP
jgi:hypothetical protein